MRKKFINRMYKNFQYYNLKIKRKNIIIKINVKNYIKIKKLYNKN